MNRRLRVILATGLTVALLAGVASVADARTKYTTSKPVLSGPPHKDKTFTASGVITQIHGDIPCQGQDHPLDGIR